MSVYQVSVQQLLPAGATFTANEGDPNPADPPPTILADPFSCKWGFVDEQIPNQLEPIVVAFNIWSTSRRVAPVFTRGDLVRVKVSGQGPLDSQAILNVPVRITEVIAELVPGTEYPFRQQITAADLLSDLGSYFPGPRSDKLGGGVTGIRRRLAWVGYWMGRTIGVPAAVPAVSGMLVRTYWLGESAASLVATALRSWPPGGIHRALTPYYGASYPAGYEFADAHSDTGGASSTAEGGPLPDPGSVIRYMVQEASRGTLDTPPLPLRFRNAGGRLVLTGAPAGTPNRMPAVPADVCDIPVAMRQGREHAPNLIRLTGSKFDTAAISDELETTLEVSLPSDVAASGVRGRDLDTMLMLRAYNSDPEGPSTVLPYASGVAQTYLADSSARDVKWTFDQFTIRANELDATEAGRLLPILLPAYLDDPTRDGRIVRHLTIHSIAPDVVADTTRSTVDGFIVSGELTIDGGDMTFTVTTTPGKPYPLNTAATPITVGEFVAAGHSGLATPNVHPNITVGDLVDVDA